MIPRFMPALLALAISQLSAPLCAAEPALPEGLGGESTPSDTAEPVLPEGIGDATPAIENTAAPDRTPFEFSGFWEARIGTRTQSDSNEQQTSLLETRAQFRVERPGDKVRLKLTADLLYDDLAETHHLDLDTGEGNLDLREASILLRPVDSVDLKLGRQVLTWGTGDLVFINDMFPKDWVSFFIGRDVEYLKAPSDAVKVSLFSDAVNLDLVYTPRFDPDRYIDGERISFFNPALGTRTGRDNPLKVDLPDNAYQDDEIAARLQTNWSGYELAAYGYKGFWKSPAGSDPASGRALFPELDVYGLSVRGTVGSGIGNIELGYYHSGDDSGGSDPAIRNSEYRFLAGYEQEIARETTLSIQYYLEYMDDYDNYRDSLPADINARDEDRHVVTIRLTRLAVQQDLVLSLFTFYSPSDEDGYIRCNASYRVDDRWTVDGGLNLFFGEEDYTFFGQFEKNSNIYTGIRYGFGQ